MEFCDKQQALEAAGFPRACRTTSRYDLKAIDSWIDKQSGLGTEDVALPALDVTRMLAEGMAALG